MRSSKLFPNNLFVRVNLPSISLKLSYFASLPTIIRLSFVTVTTEGVSIYPLSSLTILRTSPLYVANRKCDVPKSMLTKGPFLFVEKEKR